MTRSLRSYSVAEKKAAILRRLTGHARGLGYWAAVDAVNKHYKKDKKFSEILDEMEMK